MKRNNGNFEDDIHEYRGEIDEECVTLNSKKPT